MEKNFKYVLKINNREYVVKVSDRKNKKYTAWLVSRMNDGGDVMLTRPVHFGDRRYEHYFDKFGFFSELNHNDKKRRENYRKRHKNTDIDNPASPAFWSYNYLW